MLEATVTLRGALLDGRGADAVQDLADRIVQATGTQAYAEWLGGLNRHIRRPTPYYETQVTVRRTALVAVVHDRRVVYGPWLEGVSPRNEITRFKGYHAARDAARDTAAMVPRLARPIVAAWALEVGG